MRIRIIFAAAAGLLITAAGVPLNAQRAPAARVFVGPNHRASGDDTLSRNEGWISPSLKDPRVIVAAVQGPPGCHVMLSRDAGQVWEELRLPLLDDCFDPMTAAASNGPLYVLAGGRTAPTPGAGGRGAPASAQVSNAPVRVYSSIDNGKTWRPPASLRTPVRPDHPRMVVDESNGPHRGRVYVAWNEVSDTWLKDKFWIWLNVSDDSGKTFSEPSPIQIDSGGKLVITEPIVLSDGTLLVTYYQYFRPLSSTKNLRQPFYLLRSADGGRTFGHPEKAFEIGQSGGLSVRADFGRAFTLPVVVADASPKSRYRDRIYAVWDDANSGESDIWLTYSADKGKTWAAKRRVNDNRPAAKDAPIDFRMTPVVSVNRDGVVGVAWYDRRDDPAHRCWKYYFTASYDGGDTFLPNVPVSTAQSCPNKETSPHLVVRNAQPDSALPGVEEVEKLLAAGKAAEAERLAVALGERAAQATTAGGPEIRLTFNKDRNVWPGHYTGLAPDSAGVFYAMWSDRRSGRQQSFAARVDLETNPEPEIAGLREQVITDQVRIVPGKAEFDEEKGTSQFTVEIRNVSGRPIYAPLKLRAKRVTTPGADTRFLGADAVGAGAVATWDFSGLMGTRRRLDPEVSTEPRAIVVKTSAAGGLDAAFEFEVIGRVQSSVAASGAKESKPR